MSAADRPDMPALAESGGPRTMFLSLYHDIRRIASAMLQHEAAGHVLQPTALANEVFLRLATQRTEAFSKSEFLGLTVICIRRVLVDYARARNARKRGGDGTGQGDARADAAERVINWDDIEAIDNALQALSKLHPRQARGVELRFFGGLDQERIAELLGVSRTTVVNDWATARAWLSMHLSGAGAS